MQIYEINELVNIDFNVVFINSLKQFWHKRKFFQCIGNPKKQNLLLFLNGCSITYIDKNGNTLIANSGDIVYTPVGSEYKAQISKPDIDGSYTLGINFFLLDRYGEQLVLSNKIEIFHTSQNQALPLLFRCLTNCDYPHQAFRNRIILFEILGELATPIRKSVPQSLYPALKYLTDNIEKNPSVSELASLCKVSDVYFRKLFKEYTGKSPCEYRNELRLSKARSYLEYGNMGIQEISDMLGYATVSHFIKAFRESYGQPPLKYRKAHENKSIF